MENPAKMTADSDCACNPEGWCSDCVKKIAAQAREEGYAQGVKEAESKLSLHDLAYKQGFEQAREMAAKEAEEIGDAGGFPDSSWNHVWEIVSKEISEGIRALQPPSEGEL